MPDLELLSTTQIADYFFLGDMGLRTRLEIGLLFLASGMLLVVFLPNHLGSGTGKLPKIPRHFKARTYLTLGAQVPRKAIKSQVTYHPGSDGSELFVPDGVAVDSDAPARQEGKAHRKLGQVARVEFLSIHRIRGSVQKAVGFAVNQLKFFHYERGQYIIIYGMLLSRTLSVSVCLSACLPASLPACLPSTWITPVALRHRIL